MILPTPKIVTEAAEAIKTTGEFRRGLSGNELSDLVNGIVGDLVTSNSNVRGKIPFMDVKIHQG